MRARFMQDVIDGQETVTKQVQAMDALARDLDESLERLETIAAKVLADAKGAGSPIFTFLCLATNRRA